MMKFNKLLTKIRVIMKKGSQSNYYLVGQEYSRECSHMKMIRKTKDEIMKGLVI